MSCFFSTFRLVHCSVARALAAVGALASALWTHKALAQPEPSPPVLTATASSVAASSVAARSVATSPVAATIVSGVQVPGAVTSGAGSAAPEPEPLPAPQLEVHWLEPLDRNAASANYIPPEWFVLADELADHALASVVFLRGELQPKAGSRQPFVLWAAHEQSILRAQARCYQDWSAVQLFVGSSEPTGSGAPWVDKGADFKLCFDGPRAEVTVKGEPDADAQRMGDVFYRGPARFTTSRTSALDAEGQLPPALLPARLWPDRWDYDSDEPAPAPPGYVLHQQPIWALVAAGGAVFSVAYGAPLIGSLADNGRAGPWAIPLVGPILAMTRYSGGCDDEENCEGHMGLMLVPFGSILVTIVQAGGLSLVAVGSLARQRWYARDERPATGLRLRPLAVRSGSGMKMEWAF